MPQVSIIVPAYNAQKTIARCLDSVLNQTFTDFELIVMDDGSKDETPAILDEYAGKDPRIHVVHKMNSGVSDTRNKALDLAKGEYLQFLDADDWIPPDATRLFVRAMQDNTGCDMVIADFYRVIGNAMSQKGDIEEEKLMTREEYADYMALNPADYYYGVLWNKFFRRSIVEEYDLRMDVNLSWAEDFIFNMEYVLHANKIYAMKAPVYYYVKTEGSLVSQGGTSLSKTVKMKLNVIEYYSKFYKDIYNPGKYYLRSPVIYSFLLNFAKDGGVNLFSPDRKLGQNRIDVRIAPGMEDTSFAIHFYEDRLFDYSLMRFRKGYDLDQNDAEVLVYLKLAGGTAILPEVRNYTGLSSRALSASVQKLIRRGIVEKVKIAKAKKEKEKKEKDKKEKEKKEKEKIPTIITFGEKSAPIQEALGRLFRDVEELELSEFTREECDQYKKLRSKVGQNVQRALSEAQVTNSDAANGQEVIDKISSKNNAASEEEKRKHGLAAAMETQK